MNRRNALRSLLATLGLGWSEGSFAGSEPISVIVDKHSKVAQVDRNELRQIFQTSRTTWSSTGDRAVPINLPDNHAVRHDFDRAVLGLDPDGVARYWVDRRIRGDARPPRKAPNPAAVIRAVTGNRSAVGYVLASDANADVKVIARIVNGKLQGS